eukprot:CAMPEP_0114583622 /NCGR_PEP_ID=MMETSP0125-20121206/7309_1 /TAXON_ID=485358 ORGANISM="Aristerostoma sp., Strain ATCC 50986" /NCGR_SAMPLE_ID=MMETSP0125 /ASSEMBLY_ACC=CAM_ASM_000245 /LENGTH=100 /DNA_ID=CAMNT_0001777171 /DNA_START=2625 /DNA_END=2927 /DNA_ORIENTATION=+
MECGGSDLVSPMAGYWRFSDVSTIALLCPYEEDCTGGIIRVNATAAEYAGFIVEEDNGEKIICEEGEEGYEGNEAHEDEGESRRLELISETDETLILYNK